MPDQLKQLLSQHWFAALLVFIITLIAYLRTLMPGTVGGDAGELQFAGPLWALVHPTGQPLYVTLGYLWSHLIPAGSMAWRMNLLAAVSAAGGCAALTYCFARTYGNRIVAFSAGLVLGFGATVWSQAVIADKYGFNVLLGTLVVGLALWWARVRQDEHGYGQKDTNSVDTAQSSVAKRVSTESNYLLYAMSLVFGICLLHHRSLVLFAPSLGLLVLYFERAELWKRPHRTLICAALVLVPPLVGYTLFLPLATARGLSPLLWQPDSFSDWIDWLLERHVLTNEALVFDNAANIAAQLEIYLRAIINDYTLAAIPLLIIGFIALIKRSPAGGLFLLFNYLLQAILSANWRGNDRQFTYYLPSFVLLVYAIGYGMLALWHWLSQQNFPVLRSSVLLQRSVLTILIFLFPLVQFLSAYPVRRADAVYGEPLDLWRSTLKTGDMGARLTSGMDDLPQNAVLASDWEQATILWYMQQVEGVRPDLTIVYPIERYAEYAQTDQSVCLARHLPVGEEWHPTNVGALICLNREPVMTLPDGITPLGTTLFSSDGTPQLELAGYSAGGNVYETGTHAPLLLTWRALVDLEADYSISLQVLREDWSPVWSRDIAAPVMGMYPTSRWIENEVVSDYHEIDIPLEMPPGRYLWTVVVYRQLSDGSFEQLHDAEGNINVLGGTFDVRN